MHYFIIKLGNLITTFFRRGTALVLGAAAYFRIGSDLRLPRKHRLIVAA